VFVRQPEHRLLEVGTLPHLFLPGPSGWT